ncbi:MAG TPA: GatB/YqeY domain-containing protein [Caldithrix abyssi]|uniref:GatB/YqeY domain-containing protein n=1 Tax=Caldithrix abyssi TaxID=187145 RepID=A0A7V5RPU5_CALAY|nr:GatB/YqeY domain-containing protein [Caldithrix abyssi]
MKNALKSGDKARLGVLRMTLAQLKDERIRLQRELEDDDVIRILAKGVKSRRDSVESYRSGGREDLAEKETFEISVLEKYLPEQMSEDDIRAVVAEIVTQTGAASLKDMGRVMGPAMARLKGKADGKLVQNIVRSLLGG